MSKLIKSIVGIALTAAVVGTGIWAFSTQDFGFNNKVDFDINAQVVIVAHATLKTEATPFDTFNFDSEVDDEDDAVWAIDDVTMTPSKNSVTYFFEIENTGETPIKVVFTPHTATNSYTFTGGLQKAGPSETLVDDTDGDGKAKQEVIIEIGATATFIYVLGIDAAQGYPTASQTVTMTAAIDYVDINA